MSHDEWNPYDIYKSDSQLETTAGCEAASQFVWNLASNLAYEGKQPTVADLQRLLELAYTSLLLNKVEARYKEYRARKDQEQQERTQALLDELREIPPFEAVQPLPYEPPALPDWLRDLQVSEV